MATVLRDLVKSIKIFLDNFLCVAKFVFHLLQGRVLIEIEKTDKLM